MGEAPRVFSEKLKEANNESMAIDSASQGRVLIWDRFSKIEKAQRALHPLAIQLMKEKKSGFGLVSGNSEAHNADEEADGEEGDNGTNTTANYK